MKSRRIILILFFAVALFAQMTQIGDPDLFWHLATGKWIWEHRSLPYLDPFNYTTSVKALEDFFMARIIPKQYWLANLLQYGTYDVGGYWGILILRSVIAFFTLFFVYLHMRRKSLSLIASVGFLFPLAYFLLGFKGDRPNQMTFFFLAAFMYLIEDLKKACSEQRVASGERQNTRYTLHATRYILLPLLLLFWANAHGGFILGTAVAAIYLFSEIARSLLWKEHRADRRFISILAITTLAGFLNPNGYNVVYGIIRETSLNTKNTVMELMSPVAFIKLGTYHYVIWASAYITAAAVSVIMSVVGEYRIRKSEYEMQNAEGRGQESEVGTGSPEIGSRQSMAGSQQSGHSIQDRQQGAAAGQYPLPTALYPLPAIPYSLGRILLNNIEAILLIALFGSLAFTAIRIIPLLAIVATPIVCGIAMGKPDLVLKKLSRFLMPELILVCVLAWMAWSAYPSTVFRKPVLVKHDAEPAVEFIKDKKMLEGLFNYYDWGGYLIWRFYPDQVVFSDGRALSQKAYYQYLAVMTGEKEEIAGVPTYKAVLNAYNVKRILIPGTGVGGELIGLIPILVDDPEWRLIFYSSNCLLFAKGSSEPDFPKVLAYAVAMENAYKLVRSDNPRPYLTIAKANVGLGRPDEAIRFLEDALKARPSLKGGPVEKALDLIKEGKGIRNESAVQGLNTQESSR